MAVLFVYANSLPAEIVIILIFTFITIFSLSGSFANVSYIDIIGKSIRQESRKKFFSVKQIITSSGILISAFIVRQLIKQYQYPVNYSILFLIAATLLFIASLGFWNIKEPRSSRVIKKGIVDFFKLIPGEIRKNSNLKYYLLIINTAGIGVGLAPFLILWAKNNFDLSASFIGNILVLKVTGMILAGSVLFKFSKKFTYKQILTFDVILGSAIPVAALLLKDYPFYYQFLFVFSGIFVSLIKISNSGILLEISNNENRTIYAGIAGAGKIISAIFPLISGVIIAYFGFYIVFAAMDI